jgi:Acyl-CoA dehydrogenase, N-terminal domain
MCTRTPTAGGGGITLYGRDRERRVSALVSSTIDRQVRHGRRRSLPVANELDPQKGEIPAFRLDRPAELGWFGITVPAEHGGLGLGVFEYCMVSEGAGPCLDEHRQHPGALGGPRDGGGRRPLPRRAAGQEGPR